VADEISVLVVDDSALMRNLIGKMIDATPGLVVAEKAMNGNFALQKIPRVNPDVIVLDLEMPEMNGIEFLKERKKLGMKTVLISDDQLLIAKHSGLIDQSFNSLYDYAKTCC